MNDTKPQERVVAAKAGRDKPDVALIPQVALIAMAEAFKVGEKKYGRFNYCKGHTTSELISAMIRHATAYNDGEDRDAKDGQCHLGSVMANAAMILRQLQLGTHIDDRFKGLESLNVEQK